MIFQELLWLQVEELAGCHSRRMVVLCHWAVASIFLMSSNLQQWTKNTKYFFRIIPVSEWGVFAITPVNVRMYNMAYPCRIILWCQSLHIIFRKPRWRFIKLKEIKCKQSLRVKKMLYFPTIVTDELMFLWTTVMPPPSIHWK